MIVSEILLKLHCDSIEITTNNQFHHSMPELLLTHQVQSCSA